MRRAAEESARDLAAGPFPNEGRATALFLARAAQDQVFRSVMFTGPRGGEGTTTTVIQAAHDLRSIHGLRPLVVELSRSRSRLREIFSLDPDRCLQAVASGKMSAAEAIQKGPWDLGVLPSTNGRPDGMTKEGLSPLVARVLEASRDQYDIALVDAPPILEDNAVFDVGHVLPRVILVVEAGRSVLPVLGRVRRELDMRNIELLGTVLNKHRRVIPSWIYNFFSR